MITPPLFWLLMLLSGWSTPERWNPGGGSPFFPQGMGVNIHFTGDTPGYLDDLNLLSRAFGLIRMDLNWEDAEVEEGVFDFSRWDKLVDEAKRRGVLTILILDYGHPLYTADHSVRGSEERAAFVRFATEAARHFKGRVAGWEIWNEPNLARFWRPQEGVLTEYTLLAQDGADAIRTEDPEASLLGPAVYPSEDLGFLKGIAGEGFLEVPDILTFHPYRDRGPESVMGLVSQLETFLEEEGFPQMPLAMGEMGYSILRWDGERISPTHQAALMARTYLVGAMMEMPFVIWYDWRNDGINPDAREENFGTVRNDLTPKPAYRAAKALRSLLGGYEIVDLLDGAPEVWALVFSNGTTTRLVVWSSTSQKTRWMPPFPPSAAWDLFGKPLPPVPPFTVSGEPFFLEMPPGWHP
ncbi:hypothetical protein H8D30_07050 [bacterium]|nr:hypothetical protein [bacterium]